MFSIFTPLPHLIEFEDHDNPAIDRQKDTSSVNPQVAKQFFN